MGKYQRKFEGMVRISDPISQHILFERTVQTTILFQGILTEHVTSYTTGARTFDMPAIPAPTAQYHLTINNSTRHHQFSNPQHAAMFTDWVSSSPLVTESVLITPHQNSSPMPAFDLLIYLKEVDLQRRLDHLIALQCCTEKTDEGSPRIPGEWFGKILGIGKELLDSIVKVALSDKFRIEVVNDNEQEITNLQYKATKHYAVVSGNDEAREVNRNLKVSVIYVTLEQNCNYIPPEKGEGDYFLCYVMNREACYHCFNVTVDSKI